MTLSDLLGCQTFINDDTRVGLILWDPARCEAVAQTYGNWYQDNILKYNNWIVAHFIYWSNTNRLIVRISQEGEPTNEN